MFSLKLYHCDIIVAFDSHPQFFTLCSSKIEVFLQVLPMNPKTSYSKIDVSFEASINFQLISKNATLATRFARRHHLTQL